MKALRELARKLPKGSTARLVLETAQKGVAENEQRFRDARTEFERERDARRRRWAERHGSDS
ncbi:hypothetical protein [Deinococcus multiflagellatus]|uniref:Uncharacterized protein n=1 Tax=Deinococcus multiflagellatus TaxID=1656887 RepID=A0ABW1ZGX4_9DEIO|nr:hypothetical protein [Deinococcus multiflagellatus]MBZ9713800.1 hypothetical protein [Deinococcus multiflagellatus]